MENTIQVSSASTDGGDGITMTRRLTKDELDEQFELFMKESVSDDSVDLGSSEKQTGAKRSQKTAQKPTVSWWQDDDDDDSKGLVGSGKSFRKSLRKSQTIQEEEEEFTESSLKEQRRERDETEVEGSVTLTPALNLSMLGMDTLEEEEEKARFFAELEARALSTIDYSKLNRDLDSPSSTVGPGIGKPEEAVQTTDPKEDKGTVNTRDSPGSPHYSDDFEDDGDGTEEPEEKLKLSPILAKVSLYDSLEDTREGDTRKTTTAAESLDKGQSYGQSGGGSEMEALHEAYRQIHVVDESDDHNQTFSSSQTKTKTNRPESPASPPPPLDRHSLRPVSTNESDLPTAEELMRPIRPEEEHLRGFSLQPVSALDYNHDKPSQPKELQRTFTESPQKQQQPESFPEEKGLSGWIPSCPVISPDPSVQERTWSLREEVERLMQDHETSKKPPQTHVRAKKQQTSQGSSVSHPSTSHSRRPTVAPVRGRSADSRATVTSRSSVPGLKASKSTKPSVSQPHASRSIKDKEKPNQHNSETGLKVSSDLVASVQSLVSVLQQQIDTKHPDPVPDPADSQKTRNYPETTISQHFPTRLIEEYGSAGECLREQLQEKERQLQKLKQETEELNSMKQQNYLLQSKLRYAEEEIQKNRWTDASDSVQQEKLQQMDKEIKEQETLIKGYQQENERLYQQMKGQQARSKANEEAMFSENQRLLSELAFTREQLSRSQRPVGNVCSLDHTRRITQLLAQINVFQRNEAKQSEEVRRLTQEKQTLEVDLQLLKKERDLEKDQAVSVSGEKTYELRVREEQHKDEVSALKKKLQWFAENQELLDRDAARLKAATGEIQQLKEQVEKLKMEVSKRSSEQQKRTREKSADTKRVQDLERQVKELKQMLRSRNPNSLPALIFAAASASSSGPGDSSPSDTSRPSRVSALLERRVQRLEAELEGHDEEAKRSLRAMEQQFQRIRLCYEQRISELEQQLQQKEHEKEVVSTSLTETPPALEEELKRLKESHGEKEIALQTQIESLQQQLKHKAQPSPSRHQRQAEAAFGVRIERLNQELSTKTRTIQELTRTVDRLQRERRSMLSGPVSRAEGRTTEAKRQSVPNKTSAAVTEESAGETFPAAQCDKTYQPTVFTGCHISEVLQENEALQRRVEQLQSDTEQEKKDLKAQVSQAKDERDRLKEEYTKKLSSVKAEHLRVETQLRSAFALEHSSSRAAELSNQLNTQEILVKHLQEQVKELQGCRDALVVSRTREDALQKQLSRLLQDLKEAKDAQSPEGKLLCSLQRKIYNMELRHEHREKELQQVMGGAWPDVDLQTEAERWKRVAQDKTRELESFRLELDSILDILRHLQRQGVVLPAPDSHFTVTPSR